MKKWITIFGIVFVAQIQLIAQEIDWNYVNLGTTEEITDVCFINETDGWIVGSGSPNLIMKTTDGGQTWIPQSSGVSNAELKSLFFLDSNYGWIAGEFSTFLRTTDGGNNWEVIQMPDTAFYYGVQFITPDHGFVVADSADYILESTDGGLTWTKVYNTLYGTTGFRSIQFIDSNTGFIAGRQGKVLRTDDAGATWVAKNHTVPRAISGVCFVDSLTGWAAGSRGLIIKTTNGGDTWSAQASGVTINFKSINFYNESIGWACGQDGTIVKTNNGGLQWDTVYSANEHDFHSAMIVSDEEGWVVGEHGMLLHYKLNPTDIIEYEFAENAISIFPNPVNVNSLLTINSKEQGELQIDFFDLTGRNVFPSQVHSIQKGLNTIKLFDQKLLSFNGIVFCRCSVKTKDNWNKYPVQMLIIE